MSGKLRLFSTAQLGLILSLGVFSQSTDVTSTDLVSAKRKTKEVYCCDSCFDRSILMFLMHEGLECCISILKLCLMRL